MPLMERILFAIRTLTEDDPPQHRRKRTRHQEPSNTPRNNSRRKQAANLVITFRDLFASGGLNFLLEDQTADKKHHHSSMRKVSEVTPLKTLESTNACLVDLSPESTLTDPTKCLSFSSELQVALPSTKSLTDNTICLPFKPDVDPTSVSILHEERMIRSPEITLPMGIDSTTHSKSTELAVFGLGRSKQRKAVTVPLSPDDENKTVAALRKVLKWSPTKQNLATFAVKMPKEEEHKVVAVVQNAVNRVKEEQQRKKKRKRRLFKLTFC